MVETSFDLRKVILTISKALDYVGVDDVHHAHRVAYIAYECSKRMGWSAIESEMAFYCGLLHDCGVSSSKEHSNLLNKMLPDNRTDHCKKGYDYLIQTQLLNEFANAVLYHHTPWSDLKKFDISEQDKMFAALIHLADRVDYLRSQYADEDQIHLLISNEKVISERLLENSGSLFHPGMVKAMLELVSTDGFWFAMEYQHIESMALGFNLYQKFNGRLDLNQFEELALLLARIVDAKSSFTYQHSEKVAILAKTLGKDLSMSEYEGQCLYIAGLLHDIGKLRTPDDILHSERVLSVDERNQIKRHAVDTFITLESMFPNSLICQWAGNHHERIDGSGYPYHLKDNQLDLGSRIIAIADVFQALSQVRPYKGRHTLDEVISIMQPMVDQGQLDKMVFDVLFSQGERYYDLSIQDISNAVLEKMEW